MHRFQAVLLLLLLFFVGVMAQDWWDTRQAHRAPEPLEQSFAVDEEATITPVAYKPPVPEPVNEPSLAESRQNAITRAVARVSPAIVGINIVSVQRYTERRRDPFWNFYFPGNVYEKEVPGLGSGCLISRDGLVLTNQHVVENAREILVTMTDGKQFEAELIGADALTDIALLRISGREFPYIPMGDSDDLMVGEWVIALGNPFGLFEFNDQPAVTVGVISALNRDFGMQESNRVYQDMIQTDAAINPGNSGGPLVNAMGEVIGMNSFIFTGGQGSQGSIGLGFAIPINKIKSITAELQSQGNVDRQYYTGLTLQDVSQYIARRLGLQSTALVLQVEPGSPADQAGLMQNDIIIKAAGKQILEAQDVVDAVKESDLRAGSALELELIRDKRVRTTRLVLGRKLPQR
jgi:serine protease Do